MNIKNNLEIQLITAYEKYLKEPISFNSELYQKEWVEFTMPHRHFTFIEFVLRAGAKAELYDKFMFNKN